MKKEKVIVLLSLVAVVLFLSIRLLPDSDDVSVVINAHEEWTETGVILKKGDIVTISAKGKWSHGPEGVQGTRPRYGPAGYAKLDPAAILPEVNIGTLIAKVGDDEPVFVGKQSQIICSADGPLCLGMNEVTGTQAHENNDGRITASIQFMKCSEDAGQIEE